MVKKISQLTFTVCFMRRFPETVRKKSRIEIIPMIDVMMFLLVFFVLISTNVIPALGLKMKLPSSSTAANNRPPERVVVTLPAQGRLQLDGQDFENDDGLIKALQQRKAAAANGLAIIINGDESVPLQRLVDLMDVVKSQGIESISIAAKKK